MVFIDVFSVFIAGVIGVAVDIFMRVCIFSDFPPHSGPPGFSSRDPYHSDGYSRLYFGGRVEETRFS